jgi:hypothetical protein
MHSQLARFPLIAAGLLGSLSLAACGGGGAKNATPTSPGGRVTPAPVLTSVVVSVVPTWTPVGQTAIASAEGFDQNNAPIATGVVTWSSTLPGIATVASNGIVTALAVGQTQIVGVAGGKSGEATLLVIAKPVASVAIYPSSVSIQVGTTVQLTDSTLDANGVVLGGPAAMWGTSDTTKASVSATGLVRGVSAGVATITAASDGKIGSATVTVTPVPAGTIVSGIGNPDAFVSRCPTSDAAYNTIRQDFELRFEGQPSAVAVTCTEPYTTSPLTDELLAVQTLRMVYYMSQGSDGKLPWTNLNLYAWMKSEIGGVDFHAAAGSSACCELINGKRFISIARKDASSLNLYRDWNSVSAWMALFAHEARHADGPGHVTGCPAFPLPTDAYGCDATYDPAHMSSYGVQYWLFSGWATGTIVVGIACTPFGEAQSYASTAAGNANSYLSRFVSNAPPVVTARPPFGGPCLGTNVAGAAAR